MITIAEDPLHCSRHSATPAQLEQACRLLANDEYDDHAIAAMLELDVQSIRAAIGRHASLAGETR